MQTLMIKIKKNYLRLFALLVVIILTAVTLTIRGRSFNIELYRSGQGWGYDILRNKKVYIHQPFIPAFEGQVPFSTRQSAIKTGRLVIKKIRNHESPALTRDEIKPIIGN